jgi:CheY-like chemotaxis protein
MTAATIERIFDPFFTTKDVGVGTGLGLSLVHGIVGEIRGAIDVSSEPGHGSVFTVYLPRKGDALQERAALDPALPRGRSQRVMVVDDDESLLDLESENLSLLGYVPEAFTSSIKALETFRSRPSDFDAVITDERMPAMSGRVFIDRLREIRRDIPVLLVSGYVGADVDDWAFNSQADYFVKKPLMQGDLAHALAHVLGSARVSELLRPSR